ncbi:MAG: preprotein translocase subunit SecG [Bacteroidota bacterium]
MALLFIILVILASVILSLVVLVQNPKGGGLAGTLGGFSNQFMGVKQTTDVLEKGTWLFAGIIAVLCIVSTFFISGGEAVRNRIENVGNTPAPNVTKPVVPAPAPNQGTFPGTKPDSVK